MPGLGGVCARLLLVAALFFSVRIAFAAEIDLDLPEEDLRTALVEVSRAFDIQLLYSADLVEGLSASPLRGHFTLDAALKKLLADTGLVFSRADPRTVLIARTPQARVFHALQVTGTRRMQAVGANGSRDVLATEHSGSYVARGASVGSPGPQPLKDTPRSVSVIGQQQMQDQNIVELADALRYLPGVSVRGVPGDGVEPQVRAFRLGEFQVDGGAVRSGDINGVFRSDLNAYDRIELLHGADGLVNGYTSPAGVLNLVRKRPLDRRQLVVTAQAGSWDAYRAMLDVSSPLSASGHLRARSVLSGLDKDYFYDSLHQRRLAWYGIVEADLGANTLFDAGLHYIDRDGTPWSGDGLPLAADGGRLRVPRSRSFVLPWEHDDRRSLNLFATLDQRFGDNWNAHLVFDHLGSKRDVLASSGLSGYLDEASGDGLGFFSPTDFDTEQRQFFADLKINGRFQWLGLPQRLSLDFNHAEERGSDTSHETDQRAFQPLNIYDFDPVDYPAPARIGGSDWSAGRYVQRRSGASLTLNLNPWTPLGIIASYRWSRYEDYVKGMAGGNRDEHAAPSYFGITYALNARWSVYGSWADAYESNGGLRSVSGGRLKPTVGDNYEAGLKYATADGGFNAAVAAYRVEQKNFTRFLGARSADPVCCYDNGSDQRLVSDGISIEISGAPATGLQLAASYSYNRNLVHGRDSSTPGQRFSALTPRHLFKLWSTWRPRGEGWRRLDLGGGIYAQSASAWRAAFVPTPDGGSVVSQSQGGYALFSARVGWRLDTHWRLALNIENLFDRVYFDSRESSAGPADFYGEPRNVVVSLRGEF